MAYLQSFGAALLQKLAPCLTIDTSYQINAAYYRGSWRSDVVYPWDLSNQNDASALFIDVTFDILRSDEMKIAVRVGALIALPKSTDQDSSVNDSSNIENYEYFYVQSPPLTTSQIHRHCKSIDVDITTKADMVAELLGAALLDSKHKICRVKSAGKRLENIISDNEIVEVANDDDQFELEVRHINQLQGEVGYLPLSSLGSALDWRTVNMIVLSSCNQNTLRIPDTEGISFWKQCGVNEMAASISETNNKPEATKAPVSVQSVEGSKEVIDEITSIQKQRQKPRPTQVDSTMYAQGRRTYIAGSKRKKPKFTLGAI